MPSFDSDKVIESSWVDQMEKEEDEFKVEVGRQVEIEGDTKKITEIKLQDGKKVKVVQYFKIEKRKVSKNISKRKTWAKYGQSTMDPPGPNTKTTFIAEEVLLEFLNKQDDANVDKDMMNQMGKSFSNVQTIQCRNCGHNHWTLKCPFTTQLGALTKLNEANLEPSKIDDRTKTRPGFSNLRDGKRIDLNTRSKDENNTIRITNLPEETQDSDIRDLFKDFGRINRIFLAKDKATGNSKGFAFVSFDFRDSAAKAIKAVNGHGYNNLILSVEWARPSGN